MSGILGFFVKILTYIFLILSPVLLSVLFFLVKGFIEGKRIPKSECGTYHKMHHGGFFKRLLIDFPKAYVRDKFSMNPDAFRPYGVHLIAGKQGSGKTVTLTYLLRRYKDMYPKLRICTNYGYSHEDAAIESWQDIVSSTNGVYGEIDVIDEMQNWFSSMQSKNFPPEMLTEVTQQRKQTKMIMGTSQVFSRVAKPLREQVYFLYEPHTFFGCLTVVLKFEPIISADEGQVDKKKFKGMFFFVHTDSVRNSFDTYKKIEKYKEQGFNDSNPLFNRYR